MHLLKQSAKPSAQRVVRKKFTAVNFKTFSNNPHEEEKKSAGDEQMNDGSFRDVTHTMRKSKRNKGPIDSSLV